MTLPPCYFKLATDLPCPSCGMTRATVALIRGEWLTSVALHPLTLVFAVEIVIFTLILARRYSIGLPIRPPQPILDRLIAANVVALLGIWGARLIGGWRG